MKRFVKLCRHCRKQSIVPNSKYCSIRCTEERGMHRRAQYGESTIALLVLLEERGEEGIREANYHLGMFSRMKRPLATVKMEAWGNIHLPRYHITLYGRALLRYWRAKGLIHAKTS